MNTQKWKVDFEVWLLLQMEALAGPWWLLRLGAYLFAVASMVHFIAKDPIAKEGYAIACFIAIPWILGRGLRLLREP